MRYILAITLESFVLAAIVVAGVYSCILPAIVQPLLNIFGVGFGTFGVLYSVYEIFSFIGNKRAVYGAGQAAPDWELHKKRHLRLGMSCIMIGFFVLTASNILSILLYAQA